MILIFNNKFIYKIIEIPLILKTIINIDSRYISLSNVYIYIILRLLKINSSANIGFHYFLARKIALRPPIVYT